MSSASGDAIGFVMWPGPPTASVPEHTLCDGSKRPGALIYRFRGSAYARAYTNLQTPSNCVVPLRLPSGYVWHLIRNHTELSFTTMVSTRRNDQTSSNSINSANQPTTTDHIAATDQPTTPRTNRPQRHQQPPTQTDNRLNRLQIRVVARPNHLGTGHNRCFSILRHPNRMRLSASGPGFAAESVTWRLQRLQQP